MPNAPAPARGLRAAAVSIGVSPTALLPLVVGILAVLPLFVPWLARGFYLTLTPNPGMALLLEDERPLTLRSFSGGWAVLLVAAWFGLAYRTRRIAWWEVALLLAGTALALVRLGNVWATGVALAPALVHQLARLRLPPAPLLAAALVLGGSTAFAFSASRPPAPPPREVLDLLRTDPGQGSVFTALGWAEPLRTSLDHPRTVLGSGDPRALPVEYWSDYATISLGHVRWQNVLDAYGVDLLVLDSTQGQEIMARLVRGSPAWSVLRDDDRGLVARRGAS